MPKDRTVNSLSSHRARVCPYTCSPKTSDQGKRKNSLSLVGDEKEWEEARCPICLEHPHNAVLLLCSSRGKGCRPYMCDTSHRHSNCLDQYRKSSAVGSKTDAPEDVQVSRGAQHRGRETPTNSAGTGSHGQQRKLVCPLCRGQISGWIVTEAARRFMNSKPRSCSLETCNFSGNYSALRKHARVEHPSVRPTEADPSRQSEWTRLEHQREIEDTLSAYQSYGYDLDDDDLLDLDDDDLIDFQPNGNIFDFLNEMHFEAEDEWSDDMLMDCEFELDFSFLSDIAFSPFYEAMDIGLSSSGRLQNQRSTSSRSNNDAERIPSWRRNTRIPGRRRTPSLPSSRIRGLGFRDGNSG